MQRLATELLALPKAPDWSFFVRRGYFGRNEIVLCRRMAGRSMPDGHGGRRFLIYAYDDRRLAARIEVLLATDDPMALIDDRWTADDVRRGREAIERGEEP